MRGMAGVSSLDEVGAAVTQLGASPSKLDPQSLEAERLRLTRLAADLERQRAELHARQNAVIRAVSHEFRTPLSIVRGVVSSLADASIPDAVRMNLLTALARNATRLETLIDSVLAAAEGSPVDRDPIERIIDLPSTCTTVIEQLARRRAAERVSTDMAANARQIVSHDGDLTLALRCIIENALKFSEDEVVLISHRADATLRIDVIDRGPGLPDVMLDQPVEAFRQGDSRDARSHGGLGIGLYTADKVVHRLGGKMLLERLPEIGSRVSIILPQRRETDAPGPSMRPRNAAERVQAREA